MSFVLGCLTRGMGSQAERFLHPIRATGTNHVRPSIRSATDDVGTRCYHRRARDRFPRSENRPRTTHDHRARPATRGSRRGHLVRPRPAAAADRRGPRRGPRRRARARSLDMPLSTVYRYLRTLGDFGFVDRNGGHFRLGPKLLIGTGANVSSERLIRHADAPCGCSSDETGETAIVVRRIGLVVGLPPPDRERCAAPGDRPAGRHVAALCRGTRPGPAGVRADRGPRRGPRPGPRPDHRRARRPRPSCAPASAGSS